MEQLEIFFDPNQSASESGFRQWQLELAPLFSPVVPESLLCSFNSKTLCIKESLYFQEKLNISLFVQPMPGRCLTGLERIEFTLPEAQHIRFNSQNPADLSDLKIELVRQTRRHGCRQS
jgi:hypothetical protein